MPRHKGLIVAKYIKMWPRSVFDIRDKAVHLEVEKQLKQPGVYILYRDDQPYYVGKAAKRLLSRLKHHARVPRDRYYNFWNFFSAFVVPDPKHIPEVEGILIASMPTDNSSVMRMEKIYLPKDAAKLLSEQRAISGTTQAKKSRAAKTH